MTTNCGCSSDRQHSQRLPRRTFLADLGMGFTGMALGAMLAKDGIVRATESKATPNADPFELDYKPQIGRAHV